MKTRKFLVYCIIYIIVIAALTYSLNSSDYTFEFLGQAITLPVAIWISLPVALLAILALLHISYHGYTFYRYKKWIKKDSQLYKDLAKEVLLGFESNKDFKTDTYKIASQVTRSISPWGELKDIGVDDAEINNILQTIKSIKGNEIVDLKKFRLAKDSKLNILNELNKIEQLPTYYIDLLKNTEPNESLKKAAFNKLIKTAQFNEIKKLNPELSSEDIMLIITRFVNDEIDLSSDEIFDLLNNAKVTKAQYDKAAIILKNKLKPDMFIGIFEKLKSIHADADEAYVYALFELQMLDKVREAIEGSDPDEFKEIKVLLFLRDNGKMVPSSLFFK
ncbi:LapA family protein [Campylobacter sp.]|uniref:LapA family protein n=1 Tax=Campylobacter sp. TaxID=205 RepID=UPI003FA1344F